MKPSFSHYDPSMLTTRNHPLLLPVWMKRSYVRNAAYSGHIGGDVRPSFQHLDPPSPWTLHLHISQEYIEYIQHRYVCIGVYHHLRECTSRWGPVFERLGLKYWRPDACHHSVEWAQVPHSQRPDRAGPCAVVFQPYFCSHFWIRSNDSSPWK